MGMSRKGQLTQDHAPGSLLVELAGGKVSDIYGAPLDFGRGRTLKSKGIVACEKSVHSRVISAVRTVLSSDKD
jgi:3'(2'), 5'-bisphosphate nucleotidase